MISVLGTFMGNAEKVKVGGAVTQTTGMKMVSHRHQGARRKRFALGAKKPSQLWLLYIFYQVLGPLPKRFK
jgi:hypothetical protein